MATYDGHRTMLMTVTICKRSRSSLESRIFDLELNYCWFGGRVGVVRLKLAQLAVLETPNVANGRHVKEAGEVAHQQNRDRNTQNQPECCYRVLGFPRAPLH